MGQGERKIAWLTSAVLLAACSSAQPTAIAQAERDAPRQAERWTPPAVSTAEYEASPTFAPDGRTMVYLAGDAGFARYRLALSRCRDGAWSKPEPLPFAGPQNSLDADPFWTRDGRYLYFISTRHDPTNEDFDIYRVAHDAGRWGVVERLPAPVNSPAAELLPRIDGAGRLYFGSSRAGGHGQGDIYAAERRGNRWAVENVGAPVSTAAFEYEAEISADGNTMVVVADRGDRSHLYRYRRAGGRWREIGRLPASDREFQVGPLLSPRADRIIFAQRDGPRSGEMYLLDLAPDPDRRWPPSCG